ncbi:MULTISPECIES: NAD+ synthase [unclassified Polaromonas]|jgi:NAD+ synthase (glutamine-hydrolysing)|uniref:NAD+ synthase n=1 Tax=unclassified Polaromonas TaxID=2638319 RepID=UPI000BD0E9C6|nr:MULTISPECIES: NAD+ synthase [unclassified Polaromonas]OYY36977.1 MAG: NAD+ synthase [Polaromonas sp. 35-63-35]OYZ20597.1 MAG: NAD+ synthase [Polaromonas sp. 16-63-31]OYZ78737.1 MAG: NAD+ synthase [Polaromonas sp. 24-63-21]OZA49751.1 MAG: NAD+ synthase [Polaromonas sp. 17-63-33]OZA89080.1 MAG: NAD+ synthase [Polaromonas sp. 39-63-25]
MTLKICVAQLNYCVGDMPGNAQKIIDAARLAYADGVRLLLTPEMAICGYAAEDLFLRRSFIAACDDAVNLVARELAGLKGLTVVVGTPTHGDSGRGVRTRSVEVHQRHNAARVLREGAVIATYAKRELPNYQVFDERRYFTPGQGVCVFEAGEGADAVRVGLLICEDAWFEEPARLAKEAGAELLAVINASPFHVGKGGERERMMRERVLATSLPMVYAHLVGGQDEIVFEGHSFALQADGALAGRAESFRENLFLAQAERSPGAIKLIASEAPLRSAEADLWDALVLGVRDYLGKNGFPGAILGLSGGIDSALVLAIAVDALGADKVRTVMMPSPYTADISWIDAREMAARMKVRYDEISIVPEFEAFKASLAGEFKGLPEDTTEENIQARIRGVFLMALSNKFGAIVLTTGNKSEMATGYCTLYGDMAGGFAVIKDLLKTTVFRLAQWRNENDPYGTGSKPIPERIITRPPSAELRADQTDQDSLPPYEVLDAILQRYMENDESIEAIVAEGFDRAVVERVTRLIKINEYKRRQAPIGIRVTHRSFGKDWRYPVTNKFHA